VPKFMFTYYSKSF